MTRSGVACPIFTASFYCHSYTFGNLLAASFPEIQGEGAGFAPAYIEILSAGVAVKPETLLEQYGFDTGSAKFWQDGLNYVKARIEELTKTQ